MYYDTREIIKRLIQRSKLMFLNGIIREVFNFSKITKNIKLINPRLLPIGYDVILEMLKKILSEKNEKIKIQIFNYHFKLFVIKNRKYCKTQLKFFKGKFETDKNLFWIPVDKYEKPYYFDIYPEDENFKLYSEKIPKIEIFNNKDVKDFEFKNKINQELKFYFNRYEYKKILDEINNLQFF